MPPLHTFLLLIPFFTLLSATAINQRELASALVAHARSRGEDPLVVARQLIGGGSSYAPYSVPCPTEWTWIRSATTGLGTSEAAYVSTRRQHAAPVVQKMVAVHNLSTPARTPTIGFALSGGGYRAMINGLGQVMATMNQSSEAAASGIGGWFEAITYMAGLSGGSWGTGTFIANGGMLPTDLVSNVWNIDVNLIFPDENTFDFYYDLVSEVDSKSSENFPTQITDYWALALGNHLLPTQYRLNTSPNLTFAQLPSIVPGLANASLPLPIIIAAEREQGETVIAENATVFEFTPWEWGSWAFGSTTKVPGAFTSMEYLGTGVDNNVANGTCWKGFDQMSFVMGTSSTLFNGLLLELNGTNSDSIITDALKAILEELSSDQVDIARYPNTFYNWTAQENPISGLEYVTLVDAGETNQNIPLEPLLVPSREVDAILAFDNSADTDYSWPNGTAIYTTYTRAKVLAENQNTSILMPQVPSPNGFVNGGLNTRPTFFGCNDTTTPLIVYVPNYPWSDWSNTSTYQLQYDNTSAIAQMTSTMRSLTLNGSVPTWPTCLACALTDRANGYTSANRTTICQNCFNTWCWNGVDNSTTPSSLYAPVVGTVPSFLTSNNLVNSSSTSSVTAASSSAATASGKSSGAEKKVDSGAGIVGWVIMVGLTVATVMSVIFQG